MLKIRKSTPNDSVGIAAIDALINQKRYSDAVSKEVLMDRIYNIPQTAKRIRSDNNEMVYLSAVSDNSTIVGYICCGQSDLAEYPNSCKIYELNILSNYKDEATEKALLNAAASEMSKEGYSEMIVCCPCNSGNDGFYASMGGALDARGKKAISEDGSVIEYEVFVFDNIDKL